MKMRHIGYRIVTPEGWIGSAGVKDAYSSLKDAKQDLGHRIDGSYIESIYVQADSPKIYKEPTPPTIIWDGLKTRRRVG